MKKLIVFVMAFLFVFSVFGDISKVEKLEEYLYIVEMFEKYGVEYEIFNVTKDKDIGERSESALFVELDDLEKTIETLLFNGIVFYECWPPQNYPYYACKAVVAGNNHAGARFREVRQGITYGTYFVDKISGSSVIPHYGSVPTWVHGGWSVCGQLWVWLYFDLGDFYVWVRSTYGTEYCDQITFN